MLILMSKNKSFTVFNTKSRDIYRDIYREVSSEVSRE